MDGPLGLPVSRRYTGKGSKNQPCEEEKKSTPRGRSPQRKFCFGTLCCREGARNFPISQSLQTDKEAVTCSRDRLQTPRVLGGRPRFASDWNPRERRGSCGVCKCLWK